MGRTPTLGSDSHELSDPVDIECDKRVVLEDPEPLIRPGEARGVIAGKAKDGLGQIVGAKAEELRGLRDFTGTQCRARQLDHRTDEIGNGNTGSCHYLFADAVDDRLE